MTTVTISLPQDVKELAEAEAARAGHSLDEYVARLILSQADQPIDRSAPEGRQTVAHGVSRGVRERGATKSPGGAKEVE